MSRRHAFGTDFILISDVRGILDPKIFQGGPWEHLATVRRGFKEYCAIAHSRTGKVYIEEIDEREPGLFRKISDDKEWADIFRFLRERNIFKMDGTHKRHEPK